MSALRALLVGALLGAPRFVPLAAQLPSDSAIRAIVKPRVDTGLFAGIAVGVVSRDNQRRVLAYGPNAGVQPFDGNTVFEIGSITKTFTAAILADMVRKGEVSLADPVAKLLPPGTVVPERDGRQITLLDLATQSSGLPPMPDNFAPKDRENPYADYTVAQLYEFLGRYKLPRAIGEKYEYSNLGVGLLGHALSVRAGMDYEALVAQRVLKPLGMKDTRVALDASMKKRLAPGHSDNRTPAKNWDIATLTGAGALRSTVNDMLTYIRANADSASSPLGPVLAMTHAERHGINAAMSIGLAWHRLKTPAGRTLVWHNGGTGGYRTFTGYNEATGEGVVVLSNTARGVDEIGWHLLDASVPLPPIPKPHKEVPLPVESLDRYVGTYAFTPAFAMAITREGAQLFAQATAQPRFPVFAEAEGEFFFKVVDAQLSFTRDSTGTVTGLVLHQNGLHMPAKRK
ncbi:MAG: serine hydrolase [Gemmatimonadetes bacterium]|nr:serine hydrolase [Gemmatimonadota bacterium]